MTFDEYSKIKDLDYFAYCDYLQDKYGLGNYDYMSKSFKKNSKSSRTSEGLYAHHKMEFYVPSLSEPDWASQYPWEFQAKENIVYCDLLEHLYLHLLIAEECDDRLKFILGFGGIIDYFVPELNDIYSGWVTRQAWRQNCHDRIKDDKAVYMELIKRLVSWWRTANLTKDDKLFDLKMNSSILKTSMGAQFGGWSNTLNKKIYSEIDEIVYLIAMCS